MTSDEVLFPDDLRTFKGRDRSAPPRGENARSSNLTNAQVREIKTRLLAGERASELAHEYPVSAKQIGRIKRGELWTHVRID